MVRLAILGLGPAWDIRYAPAVERMRRAGRISVAGVFDSVFTRAHHAASHFETCPASGVRSLLERTTVDAVLILERGWQDRYPINVAFELGKPTLIASSLGEDIGLLESLCSHVKERGITAMPEFSRRYTPATCRLNELIATRLGPAEHLTIDAVLPTPDIHGKIPGQTTGFDFLIGLLDWCRYILRSEPVVIDTRPFGGSTQSQQQDYLVQIGFRRRQSDARAPRAQLRIRGPATFSQSNRPAANSSVDNNPEKPATADTENSVPQLLFEVECANGRAILESSCEITWTLGERTHIESLASERSEIEVILDQFCRRVVGGLIPAPDLSDVLRNMTIARAVADSRTTNAPVLLEP